MDSAQARPSCTTVIDEVQGRPRALVTVQITNAASNTAVCVGTGMNAPGHQSRASVSR
jgi:hypothetical protein